MTPHLTIPPDAGELVAMVVTRITRHGAEVRDTLRRVADGRLEMVETITDADKDLTRRLFAWIADADPISINISGHPELVELIAVERRAVVGKIDEEMIRAAKELPATLTHAARKLFAGHLTPDAGFGGLDPRVQELLDIVREAKRDFSHGLTGLALVTTSYIFYEQFHYPQPATGFYDIAHSTAEKIRWVYRYWFNQLEVAERGSGLEEFFRSQVLENRFPIDLSDAEPVQRVSLSCAGDLLAVDVLTPENTAHLFDDIQDFYSSADIVSANLESTVYTAQPAGRNGDETGQPFKMNTSTGMFDRFRHDAGINFFSTATNHSNDWGTEGILSTLNVLDGSGAEYSGTARDQAGQDDVVVVERNGIRIGLLTFTFDLNGRPVADTDSYLVDEVRFNDVDPGPDYRLVDEYSVF